METKVVRVGGWSAVLLQKLQRDTQTQPKTQRPQETIPKGELELKGAQITAQDTEDGRQHVFTVLTPQVGEILFVLTTLQGYLLVMQAASDQERDSWIEEMHKQMKERWGTAEQEVEFVLLQKDSNGQEHQQVESFVFRGDTIPAEDNQLPIQSTR